MKFSKTLAASACLAAGLSMAVPAQAGTDEYLGEFMLVGFNFCPVGSLSASGQLLSIAQNSALFALYGTTYGGDGVQTFALPDLRGRVPIGAGSGPGLTPRTMGEQGGTETNIMTVAQMPVHTHTAGIQTVNAAADTNSPKNNSFAKSAVNSYSDMGQPAGNYMFPATLQVQPAGGSQPQNNMQPFLGLNYCVVTQGIFPPRT